MRGHLTTRHQIVNRATRVYRRQRRRHQRRAPRPGTRADVEVTVVVADAYPNFSICGLPFHISGETPDWRDLAHRTTDDLRAAGLGLHLDTTVTGINPGSHTLELRTAGGAHERLTYDRVIIGTGAGSVS